MLLYTDRKHYKQTRACVYATEFTCSNYALYYTIKRIYRHYIYIYIIMESWNHEAMQSWNHAVIESCGHKVTQARSHDIMELLTCSSNLTSAVITETYICLWRKCSYDGKALLIDLGFVSAKERQWAVCSSMQQQQQQQQHQQHLAGVTLEIIS